MRGIGGRPHNRKPACDKGAAERRVSGVDEQPLLETGRVGDDDIQVARGRRVQDCARRGDDHAQRRGWTQRVEQRQRAGLFDRRCRAQTQRRRLRALRARHLSGADEGDCQSVSRHVAMLSLLAVYPSGEIVPVHFSMWHPRDMRINSWFVAADRPSCRARATTRSRCSLTESSLSNSSASSPRVWNMAREMRALLGHDPHTSILSRSVRSQHTLRHRRARRIARLHRAVHCARSVGRPAHRYARWPDDW